MTAFLNVTMTQLFAPLIAWTSMLSMLALLSDYTRPRQWRSWPLTVALVSSELTSLLRFSP